MRPRLWVISPELHKHGGTERCIAEQVERWRERFDVTLFSMLVVNVELAGARMVRVRWFPGPHLLRYLWWLIANRLLRLQLARREGLPDAVYSPGINGTDADAMSVHIVFAKYWKNVRVGAIGDLRRPAQTFRALHRIAYWTLLRRLERRVYTGAATLSAISRQDAKELEIGFDRPRGSVPVIPYGVDITGFSLQSRSRLRDNCRETLRLDSERVGLLVANDLHKKGVDLAIEAVKSLDKDFVLAVAGNADHDQILRMARAAGVEHRVQVWPHTKEVMDYYAAADLLVAPSREDAFNLPVLEAMACGLPVVVSARTGVSELLEDQHNALIVSDPEDSESIAVAIERILKDQDLAVRLSREGRALAEQLNWDQNAAATATLIEKEISSPRLLVLAPPIEGPGGIERATRACISALAEKYGPERVGLLTLGRAPDPLFCRVLAAGRPFNGSLGMLTKLRFALKAMSAGRRWKKNLVIVAAHPHLAPVAALTAKISRAPFLVWSYGKESWGSIRHSVGLALKRASIVLAPSRFTARRLETVADLPAGSVRVLHLGQGHKVLSHQSPRRPTDPILISVARLAPQDAYKGIDSLLHVWPRILERVPGAQLWIVGDGPDMGRLKAISQTLMLDSRVRFFGRVSDEELLRLYESASVFALPSRFRLNPRPEGEGFGLVYIEAGAAGLPVIGARGGGVEDAIEHGRTGLLVSPEDPNDLEDSIIRLLTDEMLAKQMGEEGRKRAESQFSYRAFADRITEVVDELFSQRAGQSAIS